MKCVAYIGATTYEAQVGCFWITVLRPKYWCRRMSFPVKLGWDAEEE